MTIRRSKTETSRRQFVRDLALSGLALGLLPSTVSCAAKQKRLSVLVLGGTNFLGPAIVHALLNHGHRITLFNRGVTNPTLFPELPLIRGDREDGPEAYEKLRTREWDVVIDVWPDRSRLVDEATRALQNRAGHYAFISSIAVYENFQEVGLSEESAVVQPGTDPTEWGYAEEKRAAEELIAGRYPDYHTILRPGPIKGSRDSAEDLLYWLMKLKRGEDILAPGSGEDPLQFIDVKDVGRFAVQATESGLNGVFNTTGPRKKTLLWKEFLELARKHLNSRSRLHWASEAFLAENDVRSFEDLPLWAPLSEDRGFMQISNRKADAAGFRHTPIETTLDDCIAWFEQRSRDGEVSVGLDRNRELELLELLKKQDAPAAS